MDKAKAVAEEIRSKIATVFDYHVEEIAAIIRAHYPEAADSPVDYFDD